MTERQELKRHQIELAGRRFTIQSDQSATRLEAMCNYINAKFRMLQEEGVGLSLIQQALLVTLETTEELFEAREAHEDKIARLTLHAHDLMERLDRDDVEIEQHIASDG
jgi:cell division protein ZapA (FtsZ GTPase activity inhibitor)